MLWNWEEIYDEEEAKQLGFEKTPFTKFHHDFKLKSNRLKIKTKFGFEEEFSILKLDLKNFTTDTDNKDEEKKNIKEEVEEVEEEDPIVED